LIFASSCAINFPPGHFRDGRRGPSAAAVPPRAAPSSRPAFDDDDDTYTRPARSYVGLIKVAMILLVVAGIAGAVYWFICVLGPAERKGKRASDLSGGSISG